MFDIGRAGVGRRQAILWPLMITTVRGWYLEAVRSIGIANQYRRTNPVAALVARAYAQECLMKYEAEIDRLLPLRETFVKPKKALR